MSSTTDGLSLLGVFSLAAMDRDHGWLSPGDRVRDRGFEGRDDVGWATVRAERAPVGGGVSQGGQDKARRQDELGKIIERFLILDAELRAGAPELASSPGSPTPSFTVNACAATRDRPGGRQSWP